jgi:hypothetical protein
MIGLAPEGRDTPGLLGEPPEGVGEFIALLIKTGLPVLPVGVEEVGGYFRVSCGEVFLPWIPNNRSDVDKAVANEVMVSIVRQLK